MRVVFDEKNKVFLLHTQNTTYAIAVTEDKYVNHLYYGKNWKIRISDICSERMRLRLLRG